MRNLPRLWISRPPKTKLQKAAYSPAGLPTTGCCSLYKLGGLAARNSGERNSAALNIELLQT